MLDAGATELVMVSPPNLWVPGFEIATPGAGADAAVLPAISVASARTS
jgi:hypothetical protein